MKAKCPMKDCHEEVFVVYLQPPGLMSDKTKKNDKTVKQLAMDFDMTNIKSTKEGENQAGYFTRKNKMSKKQLEAEKQAVEEKNRQPRAGDAAIWGGGGRLTMSNVLGGNMFRPVGPQLGKEAENVSINPKESGNLTGPRASSYVADHENLKIK
jgi:ribosomal protein S17E